MRASRTLIFLLLLVICARGGEARAQAADLKSEHRPAFDAVSIRQIEAFKRISSPGSTGYMFTRHEPCAYSDDKVHCQLALEELIREAYQRKRYEVVGPKWLMEDVFVFQAVLAEKASTDDARLMMQRALEDRFGLKCHLEKKLLPVYEMVVGPSGQHLTAADSPEQQKKIASKVNPGGAYMESSLGRLVAVAADLDYLAYLIERQAGLDLPVLNRTGLAGKYKIELHWTPDDGPDSARGAGDLGILGALKAQAGLVLKKTQAPVEVLVIDHIDRTPSANQ